jgi:general stress protein 26
MLGIRAREEDGRMDRAPLLEFIRRHSLGVEATVSPAGAPQAAVVGFVVNDAFELFFDTLDQTRKFQNLGRDPKIAFVIGWDEERTVQYEGIADVPRGAELERFQGIYFAKFPEGRERQLWPGLVYVRVRPRWIRYSDFREATPEVVEFEGEALARLTAPECSAP